MVRAKSSTQAAVEAVERGWTPVPIRDRGKSPYGSGWTHLRWESEEQVRASFEQWEQDGASGIGLVLGENGGNLVDVDIDHHTASRLQDYFLPPSPMRTGRANSPRSHRWYVVEGQVPSTRRYRLPRADEDSKDPDEKAVSIELRSTGGQTLIPPSIWWSKDKTRSEPYRWEGPAWGGKQGPAKVDGRKLAVQVALVGLGAILIDNWPKTGGRHDAYLALAGGLLRFGDGGVHPYWEKNLPVLIDALADATHDEDADTRVTEVMKTTIDKLRNGDRVQGFPTLSEYIGADHAEAVRRQAREVEALAGFVGNPLQRTDERAFHDLDEGQRVTSTLPPELRNPLEERITSWDRVDLEPYLLGEITMPEPTILRRSDGKGLFYPGRVNSLFGKSEGAKSWTALFACVQEMGRGERVMYIDLEDEPAGTLHRLRLLGAGDDDIKNQFAYVHPEGPLADMQRAKYGNATTEDGLRSSSAFRSMLESFDPTLIVADGMTVLYGLHGHDTNDASGTDVITSWFKSLTRGGRTAVIVIDHTGKGGGPGASPIGAHHKVAMIQGTAIRADALKRPMPGDVGTINLVVYKDRPGSVRAISTKDTEQVAAMVTMDSRREGMTTMTIDPAENGNVVLGATDEQEERFAQLAKAQERQDQVMAMFAGDKNVRLSTGDVVDATGWERGDVYDVWQVLQGMGLVRKEGANRWTTFRLTTLGADAWNGQDVTAETPPLTKDEEDLG